MTTEIQQTQILTTCDGQIGNNGMCSKCGQPAQTTGNSCGRLIPVQPMKQQTPLQKLITKLKAQTQGEQGNYYEALDYVICEAEYLLPEEKQRLIDANECFNPKHQSGEEYFNETFQS
jgi:hypothetical protein